MRSGTREALAYDSLKLAGQEERYLNYSSLEYTIYRVGNAGATLCAGLALFLGHRKAYLMDVVLSVLCLLVTFRLKEVAVEQRQFEGTVPERLIRCFRESLHFLTHNRKSMELMLWNSFAGSIATLTDFFLQARLTRAGLNDTLLGPALFAVSVGGAIGAKAVTAVAKWNYRKISLLCILGIGAGLSMSLTALPAVMILGGFVGNLFDDLLQVRTDALLNERFPSTQRATLVSVSSLTFSLVMILMSPLMGWLLA